ncbi:MAG: hypothetical protein J2P18_08560 [Nocardia sp.]|nr:hypothetical protein [Nocardia sp.]
MSGNPRRKDNEDGLPDSSFSKWDKGVYRQRIGEDEAARRRAAIMAEQWGFQLAEKHRDTPDPR